MSSKLVLKNDIATEFKITHEDGTAARAIASTDLSYTRATVEELTALVGTNGEVCVLTDSNRGGTFVFDSEAVDNGGTVFGKWVRQYDGTVNVKWFLTDIANETTTVTDLNEMFANTSYYNYYIPHDVNYGSDIAHNGSIFTKLVIPTRDFIITDDSVDNGYSGEGHQGGQSRVYLISSGANDGQHNSFMYLTSEHHPGIMYNISGDGVDSAGGLGRNATTFFHTLTTNYEWGIGMGGNTVAVADTNNVTADEELQASGFKIVASGMKGVLGLSNIHNISLKTGNVGWFSGVEPSFKYQFGFTDTDINKQFMLKSTDTEYPKIQSMSSTGYWTQRFTDEFYYVDSPLGGNLEFKDTVDESRIRIAGHGALATLYLEQTDGKIFNIKVDSDGSSTVGTSSGNRFKFRQEGCFKANLGVSGNTTTTDGRPNASLCENGTMMFDTDLGIPIWLPSNGSNTWVDATGTSV